ncbi:hypothetical protein EDB80DRAFT_693572 [Ilyonectria destructans]|nr:hypothetical protein EDB80DRAFT_693572 [Ilyonectria destructans]
MGGLIAAAQSLFPEDAFIMRLVPTVLPLLAAAALADPYGCKNRDKPRLKVIERDVCIIGGGSSGTYAAVRLIDDGLSVAVIEMKGQLGATPRPMSIRTQEPHKHGSRCVASFVKLSGTILTGPT